MDEKLSSISSTPAQPQRYLVLVEFAYKHLNFQLAELESILEMNGFQLGGPGCAMIPLPNQEIVDQIASKSLQSSLSSSNNNDKHETEASKRDDLHQRPFVILSFPLQDMARLSANENVEKWDCSSVQKMSGIAEILSRCTLVRSVVELWGFSKTMEDCATSVRTWTKESEIGKYIFEKVSKADQSWKLTVHTLGSKYTREEQDAMRKMFSYLGFEGRVKMHDPNNEMVLIREVEMDGKGTPRYPRHVGKRLIPENDARPALAVYFGRVLGGPRKGRSGLEQYHLKHRAYLGPTSMDAELSFVMTSFGQVRKGSIVLDPFVGTGSILLSCALRGAYCIGTDIDIRVLRGKSEVENIWKNFEQFNLPRPEIIRSDNAIYHRHFRDHIPLYDSIVCDPPYGIRAGARKSGSKLDNPRPITDEFRDDHIPQTKPYPVSDVMADLLDMAARTLVLGGRLVYVIPSFSDFNPDTDLPRHKCLELIHSCYQPLSLELGRRIVAMKKISDYIPAHRDQYLEKVWVHGKESAEKCANLREKILENAKKKKGYDEKLAIRKEKRTATKQARKRAKASTPPSNKT